MEQMIVEDKNYRGPELPISADMLERHSVVMLVSAVSTEQLIASETVCLSVCVVSVCLSGFCLTFSR